MEAMNHTGNSTATDPRDEHVKATDVTKIIIIIVNVIIFLFSFLGNSIVIHLVRTRTSIRKNPFNWLMVNTATADLVEVTSALAFNLRYFLVGNRWIPGIEGTILCKIIPFFLVVSICVSIWTITVIAADRYMAFACLRRKPLSVRSAVCSIIAVWLCAGLIFSGQLYKFKIKLNKVGAPECLGSWIEDRETSILFRKAEMIVTVVITYAIPLTTMTVLYSLIAFTLWRQKPPGEDANQEAQARQVRKRRAAIKKMTIVVAVMAVFWLPVHFIHISSAFDHDAYDSIPILLKWLCFSLAYANTAVNPFLFIVFSENLRVETKGILRNIRNRMQSLFQPAKFVTPAQQTLDDTSLEMKDSINLSPSRFSLGTSNLSYDTKL